MASEQTARWLRSVGRHGLALALFWLLAFALVQLGETFGGWLVPSVGQLLACVVGAGLAFRLRAPIAMYFLAAMGAFSASELAVHLYYGNGAAQGAPTHFAVMGAGILGVVAGAWLARSSGSSARTAAPADEARQPEVLSPASASGI